MLTNNRRCQKWVIFAFVNSQQFKGVIANEHEKLNRLYDNTNLTAIITSRSAMAEGPRDALISRNSATTKYPYRMALFVWSYV